MNGGILKHPLFLITLALFLCWIGWLSRITTFAASVAYTSTHFAGTSVCLVTVDLADPRVHVSVELADRGLGRSESFRSMIKRTRPVAAVTGTYFDTLTLLPIADIVRDGKLICRGAVGTAVAFGPGNYAALLPQKRTRSQLECYQTVLAAGPCLLRSGRNVLSPASEGFRHPGLFPKRSRTAMGITSNNKLLLVAVRTPVTFGRLTRIMRELGAMEAIALDGGTSTGLAFKDKIVVAPGRRLTNIIAIYISDRPREKIVQGLESSKSIYFPSLCKSEGTGVACGFGEIKIDPITTLASGASEGLIAINRIWSAQSAD